jgi:hypothetical protein
VERVGIGGWRLVVVLRSCDVSERANHLNRTSVGRLGVVCCALCVMKGKDSNSDHVNSSIFFKKNTMCEANNVYTYHVNSDERERFQLDSCE